MPGWTIDGARVLRGAAGTLVATISHGGDRQWRNGRFLVPRGNHAWSAAGRQRPIVW